MAADTPGSVDHWKTSTHAATGVGCVSCHEAGEGDADAFTHYGELIATSIRCTRSERS